MERQNRGKRQKLLSLEAWTSVVHLLDEFSEKSITAARMVLVEGESRSIVQIQLGISKQRMYRIIQDVTARIQDPKEGWVYVGTWAPAELAKEFHAKVEIARSESERGKTTDHKKSREKK
ncbi:TrfB-related DNA-binding protein [Pseudomonas sp. zjy_13]|uniref:TrfB-related DNA-binding protein n=1 Tax=Pseudomonas sp. zjy_13 TaxID=3367263 RepID=UPI00370C06CE